MAVANGVKVGPRTAECERVSSAKEEKGGVSMSWMRMKERESGG